MEITLFGGNTVITNAEIIDQPFSGQYKERIYDVTSPWNSQDWTWVKFEDEVQQSPI